MKLENELNYRLSSAADFLESCWDGKQFSHEFTQEEKPSKKFHVLHHLQTISVLISLAEFLGRNRLRSIADEAFELTLSWKFNNGDSSFIVHDDESFLSWNALVAIIHLKRKEMEGARNFAGSILECIGNETISPVYPPDFEKPASSLAEAMLALILISAKNKDDALEDAAAYIAEILLNQGVLYNHYEVWAFTLMHGIDPDPRYLQRAKRQVKEFQKPAIQAMTSLFAACAQQAFLAAYPHDEWLGKDKKHANQLHMEILDQQVALQVDKDKLFDWPPEFNGAFILRKTRPNIRLDYVLQNAMAIMQFISHLTNQKALAII